MCQFYMDMSYQALFHLSNLQDPWPLDSTPNTHSQLTLLLNYHRFTLKRCWIIRHYDLKQLEKDHFSPESIL